MILVTKDHFNHLLNLSCKEHSNNSIIWPGTIILLHTVVELKFLVLELKNTTAAINQSLQDLVNLIQDVSSLCAIAERASSSAFYFLDQVRAYQCLL